MLSCRALATDLCLLQSFTKNCGDSTTIIDSHIPSRYEDKHYVDYSTAIYHLGFGKFHVYLTLVCGLAFLAAGLQNNLNAYILSSLHCDLQISFSQMGLLNALFLSGGICSCLLWGMIAERLGRRTVLLYGLSLDGFLTLCSSLSASYPTLLAFRFLNGFVMGGPASLVLAYMGEFFPDHKRTKVICYVGISWTLSWVIMPACAWLVIPLQWSWRWWGLTLKSWRLLVALTAIPSITSAILFLFFPKSPMHVLMKGEYSSAHSILARIYSINHCVPPSHYPVKSLKIQQLNLPKNAKPKSSSFALLVKQIKLLFAPPVAPITILSNFLFFSNMFGYYGLGLWLPELFQRMSSQQHLYPDSASHLTLCYTTLSHTNHTSLGSAAPCDPTNIDPSVFSKSLVIGAVGLLGNFISGAMADLLHRRTLPVILMGLSGICIVVLYFTTSMTLNLLVASTFQLSVHTANLVYNALVVDMFPANSSGMGVCTAILAGRIGAMVSNIIFGLLIDVSCSIPIFMCAVVMFAGSIASLYIPEKPFGHTVSSSSEDIIKT